MGPIITSPPPEFLGHGVKGQTIDTEDILNKMDLELWELQNSRGKTVASKTQQEANPIGGH